MLLTNELQYPGSVIVTLKRPDSSHSPALALSLVAVLTWCPLSPLSLLVPQPEASDAHPLLRERLSLREDHTEQGERKGPRQTPQGPHAH